MTWEPELEELARRRELVKEMGGPERVARHIAEGRLPVRKRIDLLLDRGSFRETGTIASKVEYDEHGKLKSLTPSNFVTGHGKMPPKAGRAVPDPGHTVVNALSRPRLADARQLHSDLGHSA